MDEIIKVFQHKLIFCFQCVLLPPIGYLTVFEAKWNLLTVPDRFIVVLPPLRIIVLPPDWFIVVLPYPLFFFLISSCTNLGVQSYTCIAFCSILFRLWNIAEEEEKKSWCVAITVLLTCPPFKLVKSFSIVPTYPEKPAIRNCISPSR